MDTNILGTTACARITVLCDDIEVTAKAYGDLLKLPYKITESPADAEIKFMGMETEARIRETSFQVGDNLKLQLIEPDRNPSVWRDGLEKYGEGIYSIAFCVHDGEKIVESLGKQGAPLLQTSTMDGTRMYHVDTRPQMKTVLELMEAAL